MPAQGSVTNTTGYVNYIYNISSRGTAQVASQLLGLSGIAGNILGQIAFQTSSYLNTTEGALLSLGVVATAGLTKATQFAMKFNQEMETVHAISGKTVSGLADDAMEMSNKFGVALGDMAKGLESLARAGVSTGNMTTILEQAMGLSKLEGIPLEKSINSLISTTNLLDTNNLDLESPEYAEAVKYQTQKITATSEAAPINANDIIHTLEHVGGYASSTKLDQDDLYAVIAQLGSKGTKSEMAGTSLRAFLAAGQKDTAQRALKRIGLEVKDLWKDDETIMSISDMKDVLDEAMEARGYTQQEKLEFYSDFAGYKQANQIMKIDTDSVREFKDKIDRSWDTSKKMQTVLDTAQTNLQSLMQTGINFLTKVGEPLLPIVSIVAKTVKTVIDIVDAVPFSNFAIAGGLLLVSIKSISTIFNKIGPQLLSHMNFSLSIKEFWDDTKESLKESYDIIKKIGDNKELLQKELKIESERVDDNDKIRYIREELGYDVQDTIDVRRYEQIYGILNDDIVSAWKNSEIFSKIPKIPEEKREKESNRERNKRRNYTDQTVTAIRSMQESFDDFVEVFKQSSPTSQFYLDEHLRSKMNTAFEHIDNIRTDVGKIREILENGGGSGGGPSGRGGSSGGMKNILRRPRNVTYVDSDVNVISPKKPKITKNQFYEARVQDFTRLSTKEQQKTIDDFNKRKEYRDKVAREKEARRRDRVQDHKDDIVVVQSRTPDMVPPKIVDIDFSEIKDVSFYRGRPTPESLKQKVKVVSNTDTTREGKVFADFFETLIYTQLENKIKTGFKFQGKSIPLLVSDIEKAFNIEEVSRKYGIPNTGNRRLETLISAHLPRLLRGDDSLNMYTSNGTYKPDLVSVPWEKAGKKFETREQEYRRRQKFVNEFVDKAKTVKNKDYLRMTDDFTVTEINKFFSMIRSKKGLGFDTKSLKSELLNDNGGFQAGITKQNKIDVINQIMSMIDDENDIKKIRRFWKKTIDLETPDAMFKGLAIPELLAIRDQYKPIRTGSPEYKAKGAKDIIQDIQKNIAKRNKDLDQLDVLPWSDEYTNDLSELYRSPIAWAYSYYYDYKKPPLDPVTQQYMTRLKQTNPERYQEYEDIRDQAYKAEKARRLRAIEPFNQKYNLDYGNKFANLIALRNQLHGRGGLYNEDVKEELKEMRNLFEFVGTTKYDPETGKLKPNSQSKKDAKISASVLRAKIMHGDSGVHGLWEWAGAVAEDLINLAYQMNGYDPEDLPYEMQNVIVPVKRSQPENILDEAAAIIEEQKYRHTDNDREYGTPSNRWSDYILVGTNYRKGKMSRAKRDRIRALKDIHTLRPGQMRSMIYGDDVVGPHRKKRMADLEPFLINATIIDDETGEEEVRTVIGHRRVGKNFSPDPRIFDEHQKDLRRMQAEAIDADFTVKTSKTKQEQFEDYNKERLEETPGLQEAVEEARRRANYKSELGGGPGHHVHHLNAYNYDYLGRADPDNLMLLSEYVHNLFHDIYGRGENTNDQMLEFALNHFPDQAAHFMLTRGVSGLPKEQLVLSQEQYWDDVTKAKQDWWLNAPPESMSYHPTHDYEIFGNMPYSSFFDRVVQVPFLNRTRSGDIKYDTFTMLNSDPHIIALYKAISDAQQNNYATKSDEELRKILISRHITEARYGLNKMPKFDKEKMDWVGYDELEREELLNLLKVSHETGLHHLMLNTDTNLYKRTDFVPDFSIANENYKMWQNADISLVGLRHQDLWKKYNKTPSVGDQVHFKVEDGVLGAYTKDGERIGVFPQNDKKIQELEKIHAPILTNQDMRNDVSFLNRTGTITGALDGQFAFIKLNDQDEDVYDFKVFGRVARQMLGGDRTIDEKLLSSEVPAIAVASDSNGTHKSFVTPEETIKRNKEELAKRHKIVQAALFEQYGFLPEHYAELTDSQKQRALKRYLAQDFVDPTHYIEKYGREAWKDKQARMNIEIENQDPNTGHTFRFKPFRRKLSDMEYYDLLLQDAEYQRNVLGRSVDPDSDSYKPELFQHLGEYLGEHSIIDYNLAHYSLEDMQKLVQLEDVVNYVQLLNTRTPSKTITAAQKKGLNYGKKKTIDIPLTFGESLDAILRGDQNPLRTMRALLIQNPNNIPTMIAEIQDTLEHRIEQYNEFVEKYGDMSRQMFALVENKEQIIASDIFHGDVMGEPINDTILGNMDIIENINSQLADYENADDAQIVNKYGELQIPIKDFENFEPLHQTVQSLTDESNNIIQQLKEYATYSGKNDQFADYVGLFTTITILTDMLHDLTSQRFLNILNLPLYDNAMTEYEAYDYDLIIASIEQLKSTLSEVDKVVPDIIQAERKGENSHWSKSTWDKNVTGRNTDKPFKISDYSRSFSRADGLDRFKPGSIEAVERANRLALLDLFTNYDEEVTKRTTLVSHDTDKYKPWSILVQQHGDYINKVIKVEDGSGTVMGEYVGGDLKEHADYLEKKYGFDLSKIEPIDKEQLIKTNLDHQRYGSGYYYQYVDENGQLYIIKHDTDYRYKKDNISEAFKRSFIHGADVFGDDVHKVVDDRIVGPYTKFLPTNHPIAPPSVIPSGSDARIAGQYTRISPLYDTPYIIKSGKRVATGGGKPKKSKKKESDFTTEAIQTGRATLSQAYKDIIIKKQVESYRNKMLVQMDKGYWSNTTYGSLFSELLDEFKTEKRIKDEISFGHVDDKFIKYFGLGQDLQDLDIPSKTRAMYLSDLEDWTHLDLSKFRKHFKDKLTGREQRDFLRMTRRNSPGQLVLTDEYKKFIKDELGYQHDIPDHFVISEAVQRPLHLNDLTNWEQYVPDLLTYEAEKKAADDKKIRKNAELKSEAQKAKEKEREAIRRKKLGDLKPMEIAAKFLSEDNSNARKSSFNYGNIGYFLPKLIGDNRALSYAKTEPSDFQRIFDYYLEHFTWGPDRNYEDSRLTKSGRKAGATTNWTDKAINFNVASLTKDYEGRPDDFANYILNAIVHESAHVLSLHQLRERTNLKKVAPGLYNESTEKYDADPHELEAYMIQKNVMKALGRDTKFARREAFKIRAQTKYYGTEQLARQDIIDSVTQIILDNIGTLTDKFMDSIDLSQYGDDYVDAMQDVVDDAHEYNRSKGMALDNDSKLKEYVNRNFKHEGVPEYLNDVLSQGRYEWYDDERLMSYAHYVGSGSGGFYSFIKGLTSGDDNIKLSGYKGNGKAYKDLTQEEAFNDVQSLIDESEGLQGFEVLYHGGGKPVTIDDIGAYTGIKSLSFSRDMGERFKRKWDNMGGEGWLSKIYAPPGIKGLYNQGVAGAHEQEYTVGHQQLFVELNRNEDDREVELLLLTPELIKKFGISDNVIQQVLQQQENERQFNQYKTNNPVDNDFINALYAIPENERDLLRINLKNDLRLSNDDYHYSDYLKDVNDFSDLPYIPPVSRWTQDQDAKNKVRQMIAQDNQRMLERSQRDELMQNLKVQAGLGTVGARTYRRVRNAQPIEGFEAGLEQIANNFVNDLLQYSPNANMQGASDLARLNDALQLHGSRLEGISLYLEQVSTWLPIITPALLAIQGILQVQAAVSTGIGQITNFMGLSGRMRETFAAGGVYALEGIHGPKEGLTADSNVAKLLMASSDTFSAAISAISSAIIPILPALIAIAGAVILVTKTLEWSYQSHQKYLKTLEEEQKENRSRSKALKASAEDARNLAKRNRAPRQQAALDRNAHLAQQRLDNANMTRQFGAMELSRARNDTLWGSYGISAGINKILGKYESTADDYDGTSKETRKIKEATLANPFASDAMRQVSAYYDANQLGFAQMDEYKEELGELYDTETGIMKKVGPDVDARSTPQFQRALDKFVEATGITRDHAQQYLDYMQTEHNVDKATQAMQAQSDTIAAQTEMKIQAISFGGNPADVLGLNGIEAQQNAMVKAQADMIKMELTGQLWWKAVWATITAPVKLIISPIFAIANLLGAIWAFMTGNWSEAWDKAGKATSSFNVFGEAATYWGAWGEAESTDFNAIGQSAVDDRNRRNYGNAPATSSGVGYHNTPQVPTGHYGWGGQIFMRDNGDRSQWQHSSRTNGQSVSVVSQGTGMIVSLLGTIVTILTTGLLLGGVYKGFKHFGGDISKDGIKESLQSLLSISKEDLIQKGKDGLSGAWDLLRGRKHIKGRAKNAYYGYKNKKAYMDNYEDPMEAYIAAMNGEEYDPTAWRESDNPWIRFGQRKIKSIKQLPQKISDKYVSPWKEYIGKQMGLSEDYTFDDYLADKKTSISENYIDPWKEYAQNKIQSKVQSTYGTLKAKAELYRNPNLGGRFTNVDDSWSVRMMAKGMDLKDKYLGNVGLDGLSLDTLQDPEKLIAFAKEKLAGAEEGTPLATIRSKLQKGNELLKDPEAMHTFLKERYGDQYNKAQELLQDPEATVAWAKENLTADNIKDQLSDSDFIKNKFDNLKERIDNFFGEDEEEESFTLKDKIKNVKDRIFSWLRGGEEQAEEAETEEEQKKDTLTAQGVAANMEMLKTQGMLISGDENADSIMGYKPEDILGVTDTEGTIALSPGTLSKEEGDVGANTVATMFHETSHNLLGHNDKLRAATMEADAEVGWKEKTSELEAELATHGALKQLGIDVPDWMVKRLDKMKEIQYKKAPYGGANLELVNEATKQMVENKDFILGSLNKTVMDNPDKWSISDAASIQDTISNVTGRKPIRMGSGQDDGLMTTFTDDDVLASEDWGQTLGNASDFLSSKGGKLGKVGDVMGKIGGKGKGVGKALKGIGGKGKGIGSKALKGIGGKLGKTGIGKLGSKAVGKIGSKLASKGIAQIGSKVLGGALMATGIGAPLGLLLESPIGGMLIEGAMGLGGAVLGGAGKMLGGIGNALFGKKGYNNTGRGGGILGGLGGAIGLGGMVAGGVGGMLGGILGMGGGVKGGGMLKNAGAGVFGIMAGALTAISGKHDKNLELSEKQNKAMNKVADKVGSNSNSNATGGNITIQNININTDDDPEAIKAMFLDLIVELQEQVNPRLVSRTTGSSNTSTSDTLDQTNSDQSQQQQSGNGTSDTTHSGPGGH